MTETSMQQKQIDYIMSKFDFELVRTCLKLRMPEGPSKTIEEVKADALSSMHSAIEEGRDICTMLGFWTRHWDYGLFTLEFVLTSVSGGVKTMGDGGMGIKIGDDETVIPV